MSLVVVAVEPWGSLWPEFNELAKKHWTEVEVDTDKRREMKADAALLAKLQASNSLLCVTARQDGRLIGYLTWTLSPDPESAGLTIGDQGAWYVEEGHARVARRMYDRSIAEMKRVGVKCIYPHHRLNGRGHSLGKFFTRLGAVPEKQVYSLWIGD